MKRQSNKEITTIATQVVMNASRARRQTISSNGVALKYASDSAVLPAKVNSRTNKKIEEVGTTLSNKKRKICMRTLSVSSNQIGYEYWQMFTVRFSSRHRPVRRAGDPSHISCEPTSLRMGVNGVIQVPRPTATLHVMAACIPILQPLSMRIGPTCRFCPDHLVV